MTYAIVMAVCCAGLGASEAPLRPEGGTWPPVLAAWCWGEDVLEPQGYRPFLDAAAAHAPYTLLSTTLRVSQREVVDSVLHDQVQAVTAYANSLGLKIGFDLDVRLARRAFRQRYPDELQQELVLKIVPLPNDGQVKVTFTGQDLKDHMTGLTVPYLCLATRLVRVYSFVQGAEGIDPATVREIPGEQLKTVADGPRKLTVSVPAEAGRSACVIVAHEYLTPDVFAPHLLAFQREIVQQYADVPLAGVMKDEWGFPPDHTGNPAHDRYWYSPALAKAYADASGGDDLIRDALLMYVGEQGRERPRQAAINRYRKLCHDRNTAIEDDYYRAGKETFGPDAVIVTHATWTPYPGTQEFRKHGLDWWAATRDMGQCDERTPYACRTSLAKRWGFPLWYNQYYDSNPDSYAGEVWAGALAGGRINFHPLYPIKKEDDRREASLGLMRQPWMTAVSRLRMLDFITRAPLDCPVAVIFGHACAMNWAGPSYDRVGLEIASALAAEGYPTDLVPSSLVGTAALRIDAEGYVCLGPQRYRAVVLHEPEFGSEEELTFFARIAEGRNPLFVVGDWTRDAVARPLDGNGRLTGKVRRCGNDPACAEAVTQWLGDAGMERVTPWTARLPNWKRKSAFAAPPTDGFSTLTDGTRLRIAATTNPQGDPIRESFTWRGHDVTVDAEGFVAIRFAKDGAVEAFAAGGLKEVKTAGLDITLPERADLALMRQADGTIQGVLQGFSAPLPESLGKLTSQWQRLTVPPRLPVPETR